MSESSVHCGVEQRRIIKFLTNEGVNSYLLRARYGELCLSKSQVENIFLTLGSPLVDVIASVEEEFLHKYSLKPNNAIAAEEIHKELFRELETFQPKYQAGGCALNTARVFQWILKKPKLSVVLGAVGKDNHSEILKKQLDEENVKYVFEEIEGVATGKCGVLLTGDNRSLCTDLGASKFFSIEHMNKNQTWHAVEKAQYFYAPGFFLGVSAECLIQVARHSLEQEKTFSFNLSAPFLAEVYKKEMIELLPFVDILFGNESEARAFAKAHQFKSDDLEEILLHINNFEKKNHSRKRITVITRGPNPVCLVEENKVTEYSVNNIEEDKIKDTSAAGDAFVGGFMAEFIRKKPLEECVMRGIWAAGKIIENIGCSFTRTI